MRRPGVLIAAAIVGSTVGSSALASGTHTDRHTLADVQRETVVVGYKSEAALRSALARAPARVVRRVPALRIAHLRPAGDASAFSELAESLPGITYADTPVLRTTSAEPALTPAVRPGGAYQWQYAATRANRVPSSVLRAARAVKVAVIDTGADLSAPDLAAKQPEHFSVSSGSFDVADVNGHGTFVAGLAAGSHTNGEGIAGVGGDARLLVVKAGGDGVLTDVDTAAAITYAVDHGARVINLSFGGPRTSATERRAIDYAAAQGVLLVAAAGNAHGRGNRVQYPAALLQPVDSYGRGGRGLVVGASTLEGRRAPFSGSGSWLSLAAPGERVFGAVSATSSPLAFPRVALPGSTAGLYGYASGTSFAAPQVAGAAALVWAANPALTARQVADVLKLTARNRRRWTPGLGYGVIDVAAAVAAAQRVG